jgi:hypothetical protein
MSDTQQLNPRLIRRENGGWLAVSHANDIVHIGVVAWNVDDARNKFARRRREWDVLLEQVRRDKEAEAAQNSIFGSR